MVHAPSLHSVDPPNITSALPLSTSVTITWESKFQVDSYEIKYERVTKMQGVICPDYEHNGIVVVDGGENHYTLTDLQEYSVYTISLTALVNNMNVTASESINVTTLQAGNILCKCVSS